MTCASDSTEQGPAMTATSLPPTATPPGRRTTVFSGFHSRLTCLYGCVTWMTSCTPASPSSRERSEEHTSELQSRGHLVCRLLLEKQKKKKNKKLIQKTKKKITI